MSISHADVMHIAGLARLELSDDEAVRLGSDLERIVAYVEQLSEVDTTGVEPLHNPIGLEHVLREDLPGPMLDQGALLARAPHANHQAVLVPKAVER